MRLSAGGACRVDSLVHYRLRKCWVLPTSLPTSVANDFWQSSADNADQCITTLGSTFVRAGFASWGHEFSCDLRTSPDNAGHTFAGHPKCSADMTMRAMPLQAAHSAVLTWQQGICDIKALDALVRCHPDTPCKRHAPNHSDEVQVRLPTEKSPSCS